MRGRSKAATLAVVAAFLALAVAASAQTNMRTVSAQTAVTGVTPTWSPDGKLIAFADLANQAWGIYVINVDGSGRRQVANAGRDAPQSISWSPNGTRLAYDAFDTVDQVTEVFTVAATGGAPAKVTKGWAPSWGPGNTLAVASRSPDVSGDYIFSVNPDGSAKEMLVPCAEVEYGGCFDSRPAWSRDGKHIAFDTVSGAGGAVWTMDPDGSNRRIITPFFPAAMRPRWSPDGATILYEHFDAANPASGGDVSVMNADGSGTRVVVKNGKSGDWSPDGKTIVFTRAQTIGEGLFLVNADGTNERPLMQTTPPPAPLPSKCIVPALVGKTLAAAKAAIAKANCTLGTVTLVKSKTVAKGRVVSSTPKRGVTRPAATAVNLAVSRGKK